jgi:conjugative relaxase-like TrwC/TraI family protein
MLVMSKGALSVGQAETYYQEKYSRDDYYTESQRVTGYWYGKAAHALGLTGEVPEDQFRAVLRGLDPNTGAMLVSAAAGRSERRAGWDATFNAPKSVSVQALVGGDERLIGAHRRAVERALSEIELFAQARQRRGQEWVTTANIAAARFEHIAARPSENGRGTDPHLHTHVVIANMTIRPDGQWRSLDPIEIYRSQAFATAVYRSELAREVEGLGYRIEITGRDGRWELEGYSREQVMAFSQRRRDIEERLEREGLSGAAAAQIAAHQSRLAKRRENESQLRSEWRDRAVLYGIKTESIAITARQRGAVTMERGETADEAVRFSVEHNTEREAVIDRRALEAGALQQAMGRADLDGIRERRTEWEKRGSLIRVEPGVTAPQGAFTTPEMIAMERDNIDLMLGGKGRSHSVASESDVRSWAVKRGLAPDQAAAAELTLTSHDWLTAIEGHAGAAKTTTVGAIREFAEQQGYAVQGFAPTTRAVKALSEAGIAARTVASLLEGPSPQFGRKQLWIVDESSLLPTRQMNRLLHRAHDAEVERVVFVGDSHQHHAIEAGRPVQQLEQAGMAVARLDIIRRQRDPRLREAVRLSAEGNVAGALAALEEQNRVREIAAIDDRYRAIANEYVRAVHAGERVLVVSPGNDERRRLNVEIRDALLRNQYISQDSVAQSVLVGRNLTRAQRGVAQNYEEGEVVKFTRGSKAFGVARGTYARVLSVDSEYNLLTVAREHGTIVRYSPSRLQGVEVFHREERFLAAGDRVQFRAPQRELGVANGEFATVMGIDTRGAELKLDDSRKINARREQLRHLDYGYASTSHSSQGATVDRVIVNIDTNRSAELVNRKQFYVSISRARFNLTLYTDDRHTLRSAVSRTREKSVALEHVRIDLSRPLKHKPEPEHRIIGRGFSMGR